MKKILKDILDNFHFYLAIVLAILGFCYYLLLNDAATATLSVAWAILMLQLQIYEEKRKVRRFLRGED